MAILRRAYKYAVRTASRRAVEICRRNVRVGVLIRRAKSKLGRTRQAIPLGAVATQPFCSRVHAILMARTVDPSNYFLTMRTIGNLLTVSLRNGSFYVKMKSRPTVDNAEVIANIQHAYFAKLAEFQGMDKAQKAALEAVAANYYVDAFNLLLQMGFKALLNAWCGTCWAGSANCGGIMRNI